MRSSARALRRRRAGAEPPSVEYTPPVRRVVGVTARNHLLVRLKVFNTEQMNQAVFAFRRYEDASLRYTGIESHEGLTHYGLYDTVVATE